MALYWRTLTNRIKSGRQYQPMLRNNKSQFKTVPGKIQMCVLNNWLIIWKSSKKWKSFWSPAYNWGSEFGSKINQSEFRSVLKNLLTNVLQIKSQPKLEDKIELSSKSSFKVVLKNEQAQFQTLSRLWMCFQINLLMIKRSTKKGWQNWEELEIGAQKLGGSFKSRLNKKSFQIQSLMIKRSTKN
jgi:hypothetical protein